MCGALALIERTGSDEAVTLRAVAREVGIAAPSIYPHFADRDAIVMAVVVRIFAELTDAIEAGEAAAGPDPVDRLVAGCAAYVEYGLSHPARYGVLFSERRASAQDYCEPMALGPDGLPVLAWGADAFDAAAARHRGLRHGRRVHQHRRARGRHRGLGRAARDGDAAQRAARLPVA